MLGSIALPRERPAKRAVLLAVDSELLRAGDLSRAERHTSSNLPISSA
jgi:hypothetical protein